MMVMMLLPWISYLIGEIMGLSGIVVIIFCGGTMAQYALPNMSHKAEHLTHQAYNTVAGNSENMIFLFIGIGVFGFNLDVSYFLSFLTNFKIGR